MAKNKDGSKGIIFEYADKNDTLNYIVKAYYPDGKLKVLMNVSDGMFVGRKVIYYDNGKVYQIDSFYKPFSANETKWEGIMIRYNEDGKMSERYVVKDGLFNGLAQLYNSKGDIEKYFYYKNDIKDGPYYEYHENGRVAVQATYKMDTLVGNMYFFSPNGDTIRYFNHHKGILAFPYKKWLENGVTVEGHSMNEKQTLVMWIWYDKNGREFKRKVVHPLPNGSFVVPKS